MKLGKKIVISIGLVWALFFVFIYIGSRALLLQGFIQLENKHTKDDLLRAKEAFYQLQKSLLNFTNDWAHWDELYAYMNHQNPSFIKNNVIKKSLQDINIDYIALWDNNNKLVYEFSTPHTISIHTKPEIVEQGVMNVNNQLLIISSSPITDSYKRKASIGTIIVGRVIDQEVINQLIATTKMDISLVLVSRNSKAFQDYYLKPTSESELVAYSVIRNIHHLPVALFEIKQPRTIYLIGKKTVDYYLVTIICLGILFSLMMFWIIRTLIVARLEKLDTDISVIRQQEKINTRVDASGSDELATVSTEINKMLDTIQKTQEILEKRVEERTKELEISKDKLAQLAHFDDITTLPNRVFFNELLNKAIISAKRHNELLAILFIDLDHFKKINDAFGHKTGDLVLKQIGERFKDILRSDDVIARLGGDEFIILLNNIKETKYAGFVSDKLIKACEQPILLNELEFFIDISIGIGIYPNDGLSLEDLEKNADMAMYKAKKAGGSIYQYYSHEMESAAYEYIKMEALLRKAIQHKEFVLYFQPQLTLKDSVIRNAEALIRWINPQLGMVKPDDFIPLAEKIGLIIPIGEWAIRETCRINKQWQLDGYEPIKVAVNISAKQFHHQDVVRIIAEALEDTRLDPKYLEVEVTESAIMENVDLTIAKLNAIRAMGVSISIDDFGTGYTSINYLRQFPVNIIKIDQTFIKGIPDNANDVAITGAVIALSHNLGLEVIAEGVETMEQLQFLTEHGCDMIQGYYLSRPLAADQLVELLKKTGKFLE